MRAPRAAAPFLAALAVVVAAWPAAGQSPSASPLPTPASTPGFVTTPVEPDRPMLAPEGWLLVTDHERRDQQDRVTVTAVSPTGNRRLVARIDDATRAWQGEPRPDEVVAVLSPTVDGLLPVVLGWSDGSETEGRTLHLHDLTAADPQAPIVVTWQSQDRWRPIEEAVSGPDGRVSWGTQRPEGGDATVLLDPLSGRMTELRDPPSVEWFERSQDWLLSGAGWPAQRDDQAGILTTAGTFRPTSAPYPLVDLARGARQVSETGKGLGTWDTGQYGSPGPHRTPCRQWWTVPPDSSTRPTEIWWDRCRDGGRLLDIRWDVDGEGVLALVDRRGRGIQLIRRDAPRSETVLATIKDKRVTRARDRSRQVEVLGLAAGPRPDELLLAFRPVDFGSIFFLSTVEGAVHEVPGTFAGFVEPPIDRDVAAQPSLVERTPATPEGMLAPTDQLLAWIVGPAAADGSRSFRIVALAPDGTTQEIASLPDLLDAQHQLVAAALPAMRVTTEGYLPVPLGPDPDAEQPAEIRVVDLHDPGAAPLVLTDAPDRVHDWSTLRSAPSGRLSVRLAEDPFPDLHTMQDLFMPAGDEYLTSFSRDMTVGVDPIRSSDGWPAWSGEEFGFLDRTSAAFDPTTRLVALARGADQVERSGLELWVVFPGSREPGTPRPRCDQPVIRQGTADGTGPRWWSPCRDQGRRLDIRWDTDGDGALVLVQRGATIRLLRETRPGRFRSVGRFPTAAVGGRAMVRNDGVTVDALMTGTAPGELVLALSTSEGLWRWSTLDRRPVSLTLAPGETAGFAGFSVPPGDPR